MEERTAHFLPPHVPAVQNKHRSELALHFRVLLTVYAESRKTAGARQDCVRLSALPLFRHPLRILIINIWIVKVRRVRVQLLCERRRGVTVIIKRRALLVCDMASRNI